MKKLLALVLAMIMLVSLVGCGGGNKQAFEASKDAYDNIDLAYEIVEQMGSDIYESWRLGIYDEDEIIKNGTKHLAKELSLSEDELKLGVAYTLAGWFEKDWETMSEEEKNELTESADYAFSLMEDDLFSFCVTITSNAYVANGKTEEVQGYLDAAKAQRKELSEKSSDYEHYPNLKGYYTTTSSFFDFCQNPTGSFAS